MLERTVEPDHCYVIDRGYQKYALWNKIHTIGSNYVCRVRDGIAYETVEQRELSEDATKAGVLSDQIIRLTNDKAKLDHPLRCFRFFGHVNTLFWTTKGALSDEESEEREDDFE